MANDAIAVSAGAAVAAAAETAALEELQLGLLPDLDVPQLAPEQRAEIAAAVEKRGRGRPKGAKNLATRDVVEFIRKTIGDPLVESARWLLLSPAELGRILGCSAAEAWDRQQRVREHLSKFMHATKAPVDADGNAVMPWLTMNIGAQNAQVNVAPGARPPWDYAVEPSQQNQALIDHAAAQSHGEQSHDGDNASETNGLPRPAS